MPIEHNLEVVKVYGNKVWIEDDFFGDMHVMVQSEAPGSEPCCIATSRHCYPLHDNSARLSLAEDIARRYGATDPIEHRQRGWGGGDGGG